MISKQRDPTQLINESCKKIQGVIQDAIFSHTNYIELMFRYKF